VAGRNPGKPGFPLAGENRKSRKNRSRARESENPLALFAKVERTRRYRRRRKSVVVAHLRYGQLDADVERSLELERPALVDLDAAELERLLEKHRDLAYPDERNEVTP